ncbi:hypothetical protein [Sphingomonas sp.]|uniref:hypothetical protein n=1 Tax=Sphingomonas sp. TaxID=28214 RepID=UPI003CC67607
MPGFTELPIYNGVGVVHMNRTRTVIQPRPGQQMPNGYALANAMPTFMDPHTATVFVDEANRWNNEATLCFRGVARFRPFSVYQAIPLPVWLPVPPGFPLSIPIPEQIRDYMIPDLHTDSVGHVYMPKAKEITVQTLKREYITADDQKIKLLVTTAVVSLLATLLASNPLTAPATALLAIPSVSEYVSQWFVDKAIEINQYHFLAGRRSFRMGTAAEFGLPGSHWVFETAAAEAYSHVIFQKATDYAMGGAPTAVRPVWLEMGSRVASTYGTQVGKVDHSFTESPSIAMAQGSPFYAAMSKHHTDLFPR